MPRKIENQVEETAAVSTPTALRRSSRTTATGAGTPTALKTRRGSLLVQENEEESVEVKPASRTRRGKNYELFKFLYNDLPNWPCRFSISL